MSAPPSPAMSASSSISLSSRRVHARKGSMCAADPWGTHTELNMNPSLSSSCKLTIMRVHSPPPTNVVLDESPPSPQHRRHLGLGHSLGHRRHGSNSSLGSNSSNKPDAPQRLSFASSSFAAPGASGGSGSGQRDRPSSPTAFRSHSPTSGHRPSSSFSASSRARLSPDQLVNLARQSTNPQVSPAQSPYSPGNGAPPIVAGTSPASFTPLPDDVYLPFIDRPAEVKTLFSGPPSGKLLTLLAQTMSDGGKVEENIDEDALFNTDPARWTYPQLFHWFTKVDRDVAPDRVWVAHARQCVVAHSELIWERIKGALGVPPELDTDAAADDDGPVMIFSDFDFAHSPQALEPPQEGGLPNEDVVGSLSPEISPMPSPPLLSLASPSGLSIEPVLAPNTNSPDLALSGEHLLPPTRPGAHRMHNISEDVLEEKDEDAAEDALAPPPTQLSVSAPPALATQPPPQVQGLRISTAPASSGLFATSPAAAPVHVPPHATDEPARERESSVGRYSFTVTGGAGAAGYAGSATSSDVAYDAVAERGPGNPLFPSSFARLALGPTLSANNPQLRSPAPPPPPAFANPHAIRGRRSVPSWAEGWDPAKHEYALTAGSESSVGAV